MKTALPLVLFLWASVATLLAYGFGCDSFKYCDKWLETNNDLDEMRIKYEGWHWYGGHEGTMAIPPNERSLVER